MKPKKNEVEIPQEDKKEDEYDTGIVDIKHLYAKPSKKAKGVEDVQYLFDEHDIQLIGEGNRVQKWRGTKNLNVSVTDAIMRKITPVINMRTKIVYSFTCDIYKGGGEIAPYAKVKGSQGTLTSLEEIRQFIEK